MRISQASFEVQWNFCLPYVDMVKFVESKYRRCYRSEPKTDDFEARERFIKGKIKVGHESPLEHCVIPVNFLYDRGISHEKVRHRIGTAFSQESTRYCDYTQDIEGDGGEGIEVIQPFFFDKEEGRKNEGELHLINAPGVKFNSTPGVFFPPELDLGHSSLEGYMNKFDVWYLTCLWADWGYKTLRKMGAKAEEARSVLPTCTATRLDVTCNIREWRHIFKLRAAGTTGNPHSQMREVMVPLLILFKKEFPVFFSDIEISQEVLEKYTVLR